LRRGGAHPLGRIPEIPINKKNARNSNAPKKSRKPYEENK